MRPCVQCGRPIKRSRKHRYCTPACRAQDLRAGPRRFAYADPPYPGNAERLYAKHPDYAGEVDHRELVARLVDEYPDGWALSTGALNLREVLPLCPGDVRVAAWVKPLLSMKPTVSVQMGWEPVIFRGGRPRALERGLITDWISVSPPRAIDIGERHLIGMKPERFCWWVFEMLGALVGDELVDLFPGSGVVGDAWRAFQAQPPLWFGAKAPALELTAEASAVPVGADGEHTSRGRGGDSVATR